jgi:hypothetical protein
VEDWEEEGQEPVAVDCWLEPVAVERGLERGLERVAEVVRQVAEVVRQEEGPEQEQERWLREAWAESWQAAVGKEPGAMMAKYEGLDQEKTREKWWQMKQN